MLFFIHVGTRRVVMVGMTPNPTAASTTQQARNLAMVFDEHHEKPIHLISYDDGKYPIIVDEILAAVDVEVVRTCIRAPNMNAFIERWI